LSGSGGGGAVGRTTSDPKFEGSNNKLSFKTPEGSNEKVNEKFIFS